MLPKCRLEVWILTWCMYASQANILLNCLSFIACMYVVHHLLTYHSCKGLQQCFVFRSSDKLRALSPPATARAIAVFSSTEPPTYRPIGSELGSATAEPEEAKEGGFRASTRLGLGLEPVCSALPALHALISELRMNPPRAGATKIRVNYCCTSHPRKAHTYMHTYIHKSEIVFLLNTIARLGYKVWHAAGLLEDATS